MLFIYPENFGKVGHLRNKYKGVGGVPYSMTPYSGHHTKPPSILQQTSYKGPLSPTKQWDPHPYTIQCWTKRAPTQWGQHTGPMQCYTVEPPHTVGYSTVPTHDTEANNTGVMTHTTQGLYIIQWGTLKDPPPPISIAHTCTHWYTAIDTPIVLTQKGLCSCISMCKSVR